MMVVVPDIGGLNIFTCFVRALKPHPIKFASKSPIVRLQNANWSLQGILGVLIMGTNHYACDW